MRRLVTVCALASAVLTLATAASASTLDDVKKRGMLNCGANGQLAGFGIPDSQGNWTGLDVDLCRAIAAAIFNDPNKVKFLPINAKDRPTILASGEIDVLIRNTTWTMSREDVQVVLRASTSTSPDCSAVKRSLAVSATNFTLVGSLKIAAATARQRSTSRPVQLP